MPSAPLTARAAPRPAPPHAGRGPATAADPAPATSAPTTAGVAPGRGVEGAPAEAPALGGETALGEALLGEAAPGEGGPGAAWERVRRRLRAELGEDVFASWFRGVELVALAGDAVHLTVPTRFLKSWIQAHYAERIRAHFAQERPGLLRVVVAVRGAGRAATEAAPAPGAASPRQEFPRHEAPRHQPAGGAPREARAEAARADAPARPAPRAATAEEAGTSPRAEDLSGSPLDRRLTLSSFLVGRSNALAHAAALQVARATGEEAPLYNPLFVHAAVGLGKTHLLQATAQAAEAAGRRVTYLTAERFMYGFVAALKAQTALAFKERLRAIDLLVVDDAQFLTGRSVGNEFCHTLNALVDAGKQVVVAADRPPSDLENLDERVRSRLCGGLSVGMGDLDDVLKRRVLEARLESARARLPGFEVSPDAVDLLAKELAPNGRDLEGAVNRLLAQSALTGLPLDREGAELAVRDLVRAREPRRVRIEDIQRLVANHYNVTRADILSTRRTVTVVRPRQIAMFLSKQLTPRSLPEIGRRFGGRDHTTVLHAVRRIEEMMRVDAKMSAEVDLLKRMLQD